MTEQARRLAAAETTIQEAVRRLVETAHPSRIILFGSYAQGEVTRHSDLDFLVIVPEVEDRFAEMVRLRNVLAHLPIPIDILVYSVAEVQQRRELRGTVLHHALREGLSLYDAA